MNLKVFSKTISNTILFSILLVFLRIDLVFSDSLPTGGDMGAHIVPTKFFVSELISNFKISGWSNDWFAGYPAYYFYFPLPPIIVAILSPVFPFGIAFKIMVVASLVLLVFSIQKLISRENKISSHLGFAAGLLFLLTESFTIFGGNLASSLAGQYSFTYSLAFGNLSIYFLTKSNLKNSIYYSSLCISFCMLSHIIPFIIFIPIYSYYFLRNRSEILKKFSSFLIFLFLTIRFSISLFTNLEYTTNMTYSPYRNISDLIKPDILPLLLMSVIFLFSGQSKKVFKNLFSLEVYLILTSFLLFFYGPEGALWNGRVVPFFILGTILFVFNLLTQNINLLTSKFQGHIFLSFIYLVISFFLLFNYYSRWNDKYEVTALFIISLFLILYFFNVNKLNQLFSFLFITLTISTVSFLPHWLNWNFTGYEGKAEWGEISSLYNKLNNLSSGRIMWEPNPDLNKYGTPMVLMTIPMFTDHESVEGLYFDSSITTPYHFVTISGLAERPSNPVGGLSYINGNFDKGVRYMKHLGVDYFITYTDSISNKATNSPELEFLFASSPFKVFRLNSNKVELVTSELINFSQPSFYERISNSVFKNPLEESFSILSMKEFQKENNTQVIDKSSTSQLKNKLALNDSELNITDFKLENNKISFITNQPNKLHLIKVSYFPNWTIYDGEGPYRITPSFMAIVPYSNNVEINFEKTNMENFLSVISFLCLVMSIYLILFRIKKHV
jgi:hypothetical protein